MTSILKKTKKSFIGLRSVAVDSNPLELTVRGTVDEALSYLDGHFPGHPTVPGFIQIGWVMDAVCVLEGERKKLRSINRAKFLLPLNGNEDLSIKIHARNSHQYDFKMYSGETVTSTGSIVCENV